MATPRRIPFTLIICLVAWPALTVAQPKASADKLSVSQLLRGSSGALPPMEIIVIATRNLDRALDDDEKASCLDQRSRALYILGAYKQALDDMQKLTKLRPNDILTKIQYGVLSAVILRHAKSIELLEQVVKENPKDPDAILGLTFALQQFALQESGDEYEKQLATAMSSAMKICDVHPYLYLLQAINTQKSGDFIKAINLANKSLQAYFVGPPKGAYIDIGYALCVKGACRFAMGQYSEAIVEYDEAKRLARSRTLDSMIWDGMFYSYFQLGCYRSCLTIGTSAIEPAFMADDHRSTQIRCIVRIIDGDREGARLLAAREVKDDPKNIGKMLNLAYCSVACGYMQEVIDLCKSLRDDRRYVSRANCLEAFVLSCVPDAKHRNGARAIELTEFVLERPQLIPSELMTRAMAFAEFGKFDDAVSLAQKAIELLPKDSPLYGYYSARIKLFRDKKPFRLRPNSEAIDYMDRN